MVVAKTMIALLHCQMVATEQAMAKVTLPHKLFAALFVALGTVEGLDGELPAARTLVQTFQTVGHTATVTLVETGADLPPAFATSDQAVGAETLTGGGTDANLRAVLLATWATSGTISTNERMFALCICHGVGA